MAVIKSTDTCFIDLPPSCIEFVPSNENYLLIGTYVLNRDTETEQNVTAKESTSGDDPQKRSGSIILMKRLPSSFEVIHTKAVDYGVLDLHFHRTRQDIFGTANSTGSISLFQLVISPRDAAPEINLLSTIALIEKSALVLSMAWHPTISSVIGATLSTGEVVLIRQSEDLTESVSGKTLYIPAHDLEAWTLSFSPCAEALLLSGGDDSVLYITRFKEDCLESTPDVVPQGARDRKTHSAGVTAILPLDNEHIITGSYDDNVRLLKVIPLPSTEEVVRMRTVELAKLHLGGGVWRLQILDFQNGKDAATRWIVLASCMHAGVRILSLQLRDPEVWEFQVLASFEEHESMNYGSDAIHENGTITVVSTSFYDKRVCLWTFYINET